MLPVHFMNVMFMYGAMKMIESQYTNKKLKPRFLQMGCKYKKHHGGKFSAGWPDVELRWKKLTINIEVKMGDKVVTKLQKRELKSIVKHGGYSLVIRKKDGIEYICGLDLKSQILAIEIGEEFERIDPKAKLEYLYNSSVKIKMEIAEVWEG